MKKLIYILICWSFLANTSTASMPVTIEAHDELKDLLAALGNISATFEQWTYDESAQLIQQLNGVIYIRIPGKFRWEVNEPYQQLIVSDGKRLWNYDAELEQVTVQAMDQGLGDSPLLLLSGRLSDIQSRFKVVKGAQSNNNKGQIQYYLTPRNAESQFTSVQLIFKGQRLDKMEFHDALGQYTRLQFSPLDKNSKSAKPLGDALFQFTPPKGVDVINSYPDEAEL